MHAAKNVLVVDDDPNVISLLTDAVGSVLGHRVTTATTGAAALAQARLKEPDLVLLDLRLPDMSGAEVLDALLAERPRLPVLIVTGAFNDDKEQLLRARAMVEKPINVGLLVRVVSGLLHKTALRS